MLLLLWYFTNVYAIFLVHIVVCWEISVYGILIVDVVPMFCMFYSQFVIDNYDVEPMSDKLGVDFWMKFYNVLPFKLNFLDLVWEVSFKLDYYG